MKLKKGACVYHIKRSVWCLFHFEVLVWLAGTRGNSFILYSVDLLIENIVSENNFCENKFSREYFFRVFFLSKYIMP